MLWSRKPAPVHDKSRVVGIDLTASRARAVSVGGGKVRVLVLDDPGEELVLAVAGDRRTPEVGHAGAALRRAAAHAVATGFLPAIGQPREFPAGRHSLTADTLVELALAKVGATVAAETEAAGLVLPSYLTAPQAVKLAALAAKAKLPLKGTAAAALAVAVHRAGSVLSGRPGTTADGNVIPLRPGATGPGAAVVIDADEFALTATVVQVDRAAAKVAAAAHWPQAGLKPWMDRLIDGVSDRCVRLCRRDPRDSAEAEQALYEQLDVTLDSYRTAGTATLSARIGHWYQDLAEPAEDFEQHTAALARSAAETVREFVTASGVPSPPRVVWLTHAAGRLPGFGRALHLHTPEGTAVEVLPPGAVAHAAAALVPRWAAGELPRSHLDGSLPLPADVAAAAPRSSTNR
ncbi:hypothetical protein [Urbifossiella limnaea]|uniref:Uncharacterized protein n=1 Tax=Urbifossiella limnaea TaxID=2528023 RepID=A0A517XVY7_9BACT|nr:hypothetical protein [Urbifossiella limnaea]QDU21656.1 hypothetical protein ETAA1_36270 [Urbifossiella limnaea]